MNNQNFSEAILRDFHSKYPGISSMLLAPFTIDGRSSYDLLAQLVPLSDQPFTVLDLACGDGYLLEILLKRNQANLQLIGIDMSPEELELAQQRLADGDVDLRLERAQTLSLQDSSVDIILSHLAFMLMDPIEEVVSEVHRVLKPGGQFAAIVNGELIPGEAYEAFSFLAQEIRVREGSTGITIGDRRACTSDGLRTLFCEESGFSEPITIEDMIFEVTGSVEQVKEFILFTYNRVLVSDKGFQELEERTAEILTSFQRKDGTVSCPFLFRLVQAERVLNK